jgi:hypothetical protein
MRKIFFAVLCLALILSAVPALANCLTLVASGDTYVDESFAGHLSNFSTSSNLIVQGVQLGMADKRTYLSFDLSSIPSTYTITGATLKMYVTYVAGSYAETVNYIPASANLDISTVTWVNQPDFGMQLASSNIPAVGTWQTWNLFPAWDPITDLANGKLSLVVTTDEFNNTVLLYTSMEGGLEYAPQLELTFADAPPVPLPPTILLLGGGLLGLVGWRKFRQG